MGTTTEAVLFETDFAEFDRQPLTNGRAWLGPIRKEAFARFAELGLPTTRDEDWKYTNVTRLGKLAFHRASAGASANGAERLDAALLPLPGARLVFVNGRFRRDLSSAHGLPSGVFVGSLAEASTSHPDWVEPHLTRLAPFRDHAFVALNTAFLEDGAFVRVPDRIVVDRPIHLCWVTTEVGKPIVSHPRNLIVVGTGAQATIVESYVGFAAEAYFTNAVSEIVAADDSVAEHVKLQRESTAAFHVAALQIQQGRNANVTSHSVALGGSVVRNELSSVLGGEGAECQLNGLYVLSGAQHVDNHTMLDHAKPHCSSRELYKGVLDGQSRGVFYGRIIVRPDAQKTDAKQTNKNLLLSNDALVNTMPQLEIYADDVKCTHGATIGRLDDNATFYLRSRGIGAEDAQRILTHAFISEMIGRIKAESVRHAVESVLPIGLPNGHGAIVR
ncbi:MAG: Fe-S cluster assembly protein SufD [Planctomycetes bacterium]|nr:Fe-S cluster assembly protein SufD [Planctomycetota bacterium]